jgi:hypothetical protein
MSNNKQCSYDDLPKKSGPKLGYKRNPRNEPYETKSSIPLLEIPSALENFFDSMCYVLPVFTRNKVQQIIEYRNTIRQDKAPETEPSEEDMALLFAMQGK